jgi:hypothetical protein
VADTSPQTRRYGRPGRHAHSRSPSDGAHPRSSAGYLALVGSAFVLLSAVWLATLHLIRSQGLVLNGDEPHYLVEAVSLGRFHTVNLNPGYNYALIHHFFDNWHGKPGPHLAASLGQVTLLRHNLYWPFHAIGLSALLALPILAGTVPAEVALILVLALLTVYLAHLTAQISGARSPWRIAIAGLFLAPAVSLAATQVFPDLITGLIVGIVVMTIARIERFSGASWPEIVVATILLVALPWMDQKNIFFPVPLLVVFLVAARRASMRAGALGVVVIPTVLSLGALLLLNWYGFGHLLGGAQRVELFGGNTLTRAIALLFDRRQGIFPQLPIVVLGLAGMWTARKRLPVAVVTAILIMGAIIYGNATQPDSFGGYSFVGRFQWPTLPLLLAFAGLYLIDLWQKRRTAAILVSAATGGIFVIQAIPIVRNEFFYYYNTLSWDPSTYGGWWGSLDPSPILGYIGLPQFADLRNVWGLCCVVLLCAALVVALVQAVNAQPWRWLRAIGVAALALIVLTFGLTLPASGLRPGFAAPGVFVPVSPRRICDTRSGNPSKLTGPATQCNSSAVWTKAGPGHMLDLSVTDYFGVPKEGVTAVALEVTATDARSPGYLTAYPNGQVAPLAPTVSYAAGQTVSNLALLQVGAGGQVSVYSSEMVGVVVDLAGYFTSRDQGGAGLYNGLRSPVQVCAPSASVASGGDRSGCDAGGRPNIEVGPGRPSTVTVTGYGGIPAGKVSAVLLGLTAVDPGLSGFVTAEAGDVASPRDVTDLSYTAGQTVANRAIVPVDADGQVTVTANTPVTLAVEVLGFYTAKGDHSGSEFTPVITPIRICDTRGSNPSALASPATQCNTDLANGSPDEPLPPLSSRDVQAIGLAYVPNDATAVAVDLTDLASSTAGFLTTSPGTAFPTIWRYAGMTGGPSVSLAVAPVATTGAFEVENLSGVEAANFTLDVTGWYTPSSG